MQPVSSQSRQPVTPQTPIYSPPWVSGGGTGGRGNHPGGQPPLQVFGDWGVQPVGWQAQLPNQNMSERYRQYQTMQGMATTHPQIQAAFQQLPGWAGYLQWLQSMRPAPAIPGGVPGPTRG